MNITERTTDRRQVADALLLTDVCTSDGFYQDIGAVRAAVAGWDDGQRADAFEWAMREHAHAGDNDVGRLPAPPHVAVLRR